jgi:regulator of sigma E protease
VADREGGPERRRITLPLSSLNVSEFDGDLLRLIGFSGPLTPPLVTDVVSGGAGADAGLKKGDLVRTVGTMRIDDAQQLRAWIRQSVTASGDASAQAWTVERDGRAVRLTVSPQAVFQDGVWSGRLGVYLGVSPDMTFGAPWFDRKPIERCCKNLGNGASHAQDDGENGIRASFIEKLERAFVHC